MGRFAQGAHGNQTTLLPEFLEDLTAKDNPFKIAYAFVDALDPASMGFEGTTHVNTRRPSYHLAVLFKLYISGYLNHVQLSQRLERECQRNVGLM